MRFKGHDGRSDIHTINLVKREMMDFGSLIKKGLLGYQPIFFPNGVISGTGFQFFGNLKSMRAAAEPEREATYESAPNAHAIKVNASFNFNKGRLGNLYIPKSLGNPAEFNTEFYYCVDEADLEHFARYNMALLEMYQYFANQAMEISRGNGCKLESMVEIGSNTCLFPLAFAKNGVADCYGADIVDYSEVVGLLSEIQGAKVSFRHMADDSDDTWKSLPKTDLVWSYAVLLHQSNPLAHLTRLASLAKKAIFVMTLCDSHDWKSDEEMAIRYLSANSYYNADFPNCFDVTIVSPALIKYSLQRLGFSRIIEIPHPDFELLDDFSRADLKYWLKKHCFFLAFRDDALDDHALNDYSVSAERSPYRGNNVLVHTGFHNNVVLSQSRYYIVPHGSEFVGDGSDDHLQSFSSLTNAMKTLVELSSEKNPSPLLMRALNNHNLIRYKKRIYLCPHGMHVKFDDPRELEGLHSLESIEKWEVLLAQVPEKDCSVFSGVLTDIVGDICVLQTALGHHVAVRIGQSLESPCAEGQTTTEVVMKIHVQEMLAKMEQEARANEAKLFAMSGKALCKIPSGGYQLCDESSGEILSSYDSVEEAWRAMLSQK